MSNLKNILLNKKTCKSVWFMRQAGRYLPEFRKIRSANTNFVKLCLNSELSSEITMQPIKRFDLDSAIIFSDILMLPFALNQDLQFKENIGPKLGNFSIKNFLKHGSGDFTDKLKPIYKAIEITRQKLNKDKSLICFVGAPWTLLVYMLDIKKNNNEINLDKLSQIGSNFEEILEQLIKFICIHIENQMNAGADVVQIFDSWAGLIPKEKLNTLCFKPHVKIVTFCKKNEIPNICFPKGIKKMYQEFNNLVKPDGINIDPEINPVWARENLKNVVIQGGLNPKILFKSDDEMFQEATKYIKTLNDSPYVFNLGHGLLPETDPDKLKKLIEFYRYF